MQKFTVKGKRIAIEPKTFNPKRPILYSLRSCASGGRYQERAWFQDISVDEQEFNFDQ